MKYEGKQYYFQKNLQGDVVAIYQNFSKVATYTYDAWGNIIDSTDTSDVWIGTKNPFRYRGYYYDTDTGLYYLNSRYYDPQVGRFISADGFVSTGQGLLGSNMFAYSLNNPSNFSDSSGMRAVCANNADIGGFTVAKAKTQTNSTKGFWDDTCHFFSTLGTSLAESVYCSFSYGLGIGGSQKVGPVEMEATAVIIERANSFDFAGDYDDIVRSSLSINAKVTENAKLGVEFEYSSPYGAAQYYGGLINSPLGKGNIFVGASLGEYGLLGYTNDTSKKDNIISFGATGYFIIGGGLDISFNINEFIDTWRAEW